MEVSRSVCRLRVHSIIRIFSVILFLSAMIHHSGARTVREPEVKKLTDEYFDFRLRENPDFAATYGFTEYRGHVAQWNREAFNRRIKTSEEMLMRVDELLDHDIEDRRDMVGLQIISYTLRAFIEGSAYMNYTATLYGGLSSMGSRLIYHPADTLEKLNYWYREVFEYQTVFSNLMELLDEGVASGLMPVFTVCQNHLSVLRSLLGSSTTDFFAFRPWIDLNTTINNRPFYTMGHQACEELRTAMINYANKFRKDYLPNCRDLNHASMSSMPGGAEAYEAALRLFTTNGTTPPKAHELGLEEVERIKLEMEEIVKRQGFDGTVKEYVKTLYNDPNEYFPTRETLLQGYKDMLNKRIRPNLSKQFNPEPAIGLNVEDTPWGSLGQYVLPRARSIGNGFTNGIFQYDGSEPSKLLKVSMLVIMIHETLPGHHYQLAHTLLSSLPDYRKYVGPEDDRYGAFNFPAYTAYVEGWGLYAEYLSAEMGIVKTDNEKLGKLSMESLRGARLVVDTGIHYYNWTPYYAIDYLEANTMLSKRSSRSQISRYIRFPGQACSYKIGEIKFKSLRKKAENALGANFDPKSFHAAILALGRSPIEIVEQEMNHWIERQSASGATAGGLWSESLLMVLLIVTLEEHFDICNN